MLSIFPALIRSNQRIDGIELHVPVIGYLDYGIQWLLYAVVDDRVDTHRDGIFGENFLRWNIERHRPQVDAHTVVHAWHHEKRPC